MMASSKERTNERCIADTYHGHRRAHDESSFQRDRDDETA